MAQIKIKYFGPIREGFLENDGFLDIHKITVFIGDQGAGKSCVAKLISLMMWIEKGLFRKQFAENELVSYSRFTNKYAAFHNISNFFNSRTEIQYKGDYCFMEYRDKRLKIELLPINDIYKMPKIMYVPAERNFFSAIRFSDLRKLKDLPASWFTFLEELEKAQLYWSESEVVLPIGDARIKFDKTTNTNFLLGSDYQIKLSEASSGFQSLAPLYLVSHFLAKSIHEKLENANHQALSSEEKKRIEAETARILANPKLTEAVKMAALEALSKQFDRQCFINIVEEPEQNLYPNSQRALLYSLIGFANLHPHNQLILTTHSPYTINHLSIAIYANKLAREIGQKNNNLAMEQLYQIVPQNACISGEDVAVYELNGDGTIHKLQQFDGIPSDKNLLNQKLAEGNTILDSLFEIEENL